MNEKIMIVRLINLGFNVPQTAIKGHMVTGPGSI